MESQISNPRFQVNWSAVVAVFLGTAMTLCVRGYRFGESNHAVYLVDALRRIDPTLLRNDWWTQSTLQYHFVFNAITAGLMRLGILQPAFLVGYLALVVLLHVAWRKLVMRVGGGHGTYLLSVILYYLLAGGVGLGMYHFLQDSAFLPSNISNVAMLWGVYFLIAGKPASAGVCLGIAGVFHINHAVVGIGLWAGMALFEGRRTPARGWMIGTVPLLVLSAVQIVPAIRIVLARSGKLPLQEFVDLFVRVRHPHHFDPGAWHWGVWLAFLAPLPLAVLAYRRARPWPERRRAAVLFGLFAAMLAFALVVAGFWFAGETFVQLNLYRFSIYLKLFGCVGLAWVLWDEYGAPKRQVVWGMAVIGLLLCPVAWLSTSPFGWELPPGLWTPALRHNARVFWLFMMLAGACIGPMVPIPWKHTRRLHLSMALGVAMAAIHFGGLPMGIRVGGLEGDDAGYRAVAAWARDNTPVDAVFLVPPDEESFRLRARRAIVVNFKGVPQLSAELPEWRDRLLNVLDFGSTRDLLALPRPMGRTLGAMRSRYDSLPPEHLFGVARRYGARYIVLTRRPGGTPAGKTVFDNGGYFLYDLNPEPQTLKPSSMIITAHAHARAGLVGNPSDGYFGKTISFIIRNFKATVRLWESPHFEILPTHGDLDRFDSVGAFLRDQKLHGYYGGLRLIKASIKRFFDYCHQKGLEPGDRSFTVGYETDIPRLVGLSGSSAITTAMMRALMEFYEVEIPKDYLPTLILSVEKDELGIAAGLQDRVIQVYEGVVYMDFDRKLMESRGYGHYDELHPAKMPPLYVAYDPERAEVSDVPHRNLRQLFERGDPTVVSAMQKYRDLTDKGRVALMSADWDALGRIMNENFDLRKTFMNIAPENQRMVEVARSTGASAKFCGSGGAICGLYKDGRQYQQLVDALAALRCNVLRPIIYEA